MPDFVATAVPSTGERRRRTVAERFMARFPGSWRAYAAAAQRMIRNPGSRLRRAFVRRNMRSAYAAANRRDFELMLVRYDRDVKVEYDPQFAALGLSGPYRGHDRFVEFLDTWGEAWEEWEIQPAMLIDLGDRFLGLGRVHLPGTASGVVLEREFAQVIAVRSGQVVEEHDFMAWDEALRAVGLDPDEVELPPRP